MVSSKKWVEERVKERRMIAAKMAKENPALLDLAKRFDLQLIHPEQEVYDYNNKK